MFRLACLAWLLWSQVFVSDVRMVNLTVSVRDGSGHSIPDLKPEEFEVREDGVPQKVAVAESEKTPFNLALLLDLSGSTKPDRAAMKEAARRLIGIARPRDRVAVYAMANDRFQVISTLTGDRRRLLDLVEAIPDVTGGTPLYAAIASSYAEEFARRPQERNALIVISDGIDSSFDRTNPLPAVWMSFEALRRTAHEMSMLIYPVFLGSENIFYGQRARRRMEDLANLTGGMLFSARSIRDLEPIYAQMADELSTVYSVAYYPSNQNFNGAFRRVQVRVKRAGVKLRTRAGYSALPLL